MGFLAALVLAAAGLGQPVLADVGAPAEQGSLVAPRLTVSITDNGLAHVFGRHVPGGALSSGKSVLGAGEDVAALIRQAENVAPVTQANGRLAYVVDAGRTVGTDRARNALTTQYTVITEADGTLVTAFPGLPGG